MTTGRGLVKVTARGYYVSEVMAEKDARELASGVHDRVAHIGDGPGFITFPARHDRDVTIRAREIVAIEYVADRGDARPAEGPPPQAIAVHESDGPSPAPSPAVVAALGPRRRTWVP